MYFLKRGAVKNGLLSFLFLGITCLLVFTGCAGNETGVSGTSDGTDPSSSGFVSNSSTNDGTEYLWRVDIPTGPSDITIPRSYLVIGEKQYYVRESIPEVETLSSEWTFTGTVNVSIDWRENTYDVDADTKTIVSNCVPKGARVYQWNHFAAVECSGFYVVFQDGSIS